MKAIIQAKTRAILDSYDRGDISYSRMNELFNELADSFAIKFALWKETIGQDENGLYYNESRAQISRKNPVDIKGLLEAFKRTISQAE